MPLDIDARVTAVLGPTNTGKTHYAIERMLAHRSGVIGLPLRLLAREVYDRIVALRGPSVVALVTGEERIVPARAAYWVCTVEAMPEGLMPDFLAVDEIQLCADPDRGHIFTDRLLNARGVSETLFLGSDTMRARIASLIPRARFLRRERFSKLSYSGPRKLSRMPPRSAIVGFSAEDVYAIAELIRRQKGGAAVVMGALSPRTRNAQVALFQNGDVDHLVATDAIGMGLNLDVAHVAFSGTVKFDGRRYRHLQPNELAQIAGRAGRFTRDGTFGVTGEAPPLDPDVVEAIENHDFLPVRRLQWRNSRLDFATTEALLASLEAPSGHPDLARAREADDVMTLRALSDLPEIARTLRDARAVRLLWDVCQIPDFRKVSLHEHASLAARIYGFLHDKGGVPTDWLARQVARIDRVEGDIDALSQRLAYIRTWTYVAQRRDWVEDADHWREETRAVEDRLSDALHARLTQRFVDRRTSVLMRRLKQRESLVAHVTEQGEVSIDGEFVGRLDGFRFRLDPKAEGEEAKTLRAAGIAALAPVLSLKADRFYNAPDTEIDVTEQGGLMWGEFAVGRLVAGPDPLSPRAISFVDEDAAPGIGEKVARRLQHWIDRQVAARFEPLLALRADEGLAGLARGIAFRLVESLGILPRSEIADEVKALDQEGRGSLRRHGVRFGQFSVFMPALLKPAPTRLRLILWSLAEGFDEFPEAPPAGLVTMPAVRGAPRGYYSRAGYRLAGDRAIRIDMLERLADMLRAQDARAGFEASPEMLSITGLSLDQFARLMAGLGYEAEQGTRPKQRPSKPSTAEGGIPAGEARGEGAAVPGAAMPPVGAAAVPPDQEMAAAGQGADVPPGAAGSAGGEDGGRRGQALAEDAAPRPDPGMEAADPATEVGQTAAAEAAATAMPEVQAAPAAEPQESPASRSEPVATASPAVPVVAEGGATPPPSPEPGTSASSAASVVAEGGATPPPSPEPGTTASSAASVVAEGGATSSRSPEPAATASRAVSVVDEGGATPPPSPESGAAVPPGTETAAAGPGSADPAAAAGGEPTETEVFYIFRRVQRQRGRGRGPDAGAAAAEERGRKQRADRGRRDRAGKGRAKADRDDRPRHERGSEDKAPRERAEREERGKGQGRPDRQEKAVDPDSPFAALLALKLRQ
jgi:ATP-dependent RNA helicase SUPV3L1/SUV3